MIAEYMHGVAGVKTILVLGPGGGLEPLITFAQVFGCAGVPECPRSAGRYPGSGRPR